LSVEAEQLRGRALTDVAPDMAGLIHEARKRPHRIAERTLTVTQADGGVRRLLVRVTAEVESGLVTGFVATFDDITELLSAQRKAAWADVARRIAHEIKNPLTPIQLSAERLKRKYLRQIDDDPQTFETCTDIIVRHVGDIGRMVDEFSSFARMPAPSIHEENLGDLAKQAMFLQRGAHPDIDFALEAPTAPVIVPCDREQVGRALTNLIQNAVDAIGRRPEPEAGTAPQGQVRVRLIDEPKLRAIEVEDNGCGLPTRERYRLTEPYVTTRDEGTGLGLAIVKKIMEDHGGDLHLTDRPGGGARVALIFPSADPMTDAAAGAAPAAE
jgi:two-component system nitrogen regulation sensor histidine kinase NtrY